MRNFAEDFTKEYVKTFLTRVLPEGTDLTPIEKVLSEGGLDSLVTSVEEAFSKGATLEEFQEVDEFFRKESVMRVLSLTESIQTDLSQVLIGMLQEIILSEQQEE
ncbi:hypothetical protein [Pseudomonas helleri]|uniref:DUF7375 domain-containing protein n=1 Tax=Pseudomonas helleri TaxID=1608996 RepID=UPI002430905F|nr:hypothetical protein [Pseudomonas helleri]